MRFSLSGTAAVALDLTIEAPTGFLLEKRDGAFIATAHLSMDGAYVSA